MMSYKTVEQARKEMKEIDPQLLEKYKIKEVEGGVQLLRGDVANVISIISRHGPPVKSYGAEDGLYEIYIPRKDHKALESIVGRKISDDVVGYLTLSDAVEIAEAIISARSEK